MSSGGLHFLKGPFFRGLFFGERLLYGGASVWGHTCVTKSPGLILRGNFHFKTDWVSFFLEGKVYMLQCRICSGLLRTVIFGCDFHV